MEQLMGWMVEAIVGVVFTPIRCVVYCREYSGAEQRTRFARLWSERSVCEGLFARLFVVFSVFCQVLVWRVDVAGVTGKLTKPPPP